MGESRLRMAYGEALLELGKEYKNIAVVAADLSKSTEVIRFAEEFPERFFNLGVAEEDAFSFAAGLAAEGEPVFISTFAIFGTSLAWGQIRQNICLPNLPVKLVLTHGGVNVGQDGASHQALEDIALMRVLPNMKVIIPADAHETRAATRAAIKIPGPVYIRLPREAGEVIYDSKVNFRLGECKVHLHKKNPEATILASGLMVYKAILAAKDLENLGIETEVINMSSIKPLDEWYLLRVAKVAKAIVTVEEHSIIGGLGDAVCEFLVDKSCRPPITRLGIPDQFGQSGTPDELCEYYGLTKEKIVQTVLELLK